MYIKILLGLIIILVFAVGGLLLFNIQNQNAELDTDTEKSAEETVSVTTKVPAPGFERVVDETVAVPEQSVTVIYTDGGFSPEKVTIKSGQTVRFVNESAAGMWVASAVHPTHTVYPEKSPSDCLGSSFDACAVTSSGESWSFTFNEAGEWGYHNHVRANHRGTVVVK